MQALYGMRHVIDESRPNMFVEVEDTNAADFHEFLSEMKYDVVERYKRYAGNENFLAVPAEVNAQRNISRF